MNALVSQFINTECGVIDYAKSENSQRGLKAVQKTAGGYKRKSAYKSHILTKMTTKAESASCGDFNDPQERQDF